MPPSSSGPGCQVLSLKTGVQIPLGVHITAAMDAMETNSPGNQKNIFRHFFENKLFQLSAVFLSQNLPANDANCVKRSASNKTAFWKGGKARLNEAKSKYAVNRFVDFRHYTNRILFHDKREPASIARLKTGHPLILPIALYKIFHEQSPV